MLREETAREELSVVVFRSPCALLVGQMEPLVAVDEEACTACGVCIQPRLSGHRHGTRAAWLMIDVSLCVGCGDCVQVCKFDAIEEAGPACDIGRCVHERRSTVMLAGVGGQGTILAADVLAKVAAAAGYDVKLSEVHGMAQRGGSVDTTVRFGAEVFAPIIDPGAADHLVAFEMLEAARERALRAS